MMSWVRALVWVMPQATCGTTGASLRKLSITGSSSPSCRSSRSQAMVRPSRRGGVPVLRRPMGSAEAVEAVRERLGRRLAHAAAGAGAVADMDHAVEEGAGGQDHGAGADRATRRRGDARDAAVLHEEVGGLALDERQVRAGGELGLDGLAVELAVGLGAGTLDGGALGAVEEAELDAGAVGHAAHDAVERVHLAHEVALAQAADGRVAGHHADGGELERQQHRARAGARGGVRGLAAGMAAAHHDRRPQSRFT